MEHTILFRLNIVLSDSTFQFRSRTKVLLNYTKFKVLDLNQLISRCYDKYNGRLKAFIMTVIINGLLSIHAVIHKI